MTDRSSKIVLVVEDEWIIAESLTDMLVDMGFSVLGPAPNCAKAIALLAEMSPAFALLDVSLGQEKSFRVAAILREKGIPFIFLTGYLASDLPASYADVPVLAKPVHDGALRKLLPELLDS